MTAANTRSTYRHRLPVRIMHWTNVVCLFVLIGSGLQIFLAHPMLYWGDDAEFSKPALSLTGKPGTDGRLHGITQVGSLRVDSTGLLGVSKNMMGKPVARAFPTWATIPGARNLAQGRRWHFFFAWVFVINGALYWLWSWRARHLRDDLLPTGGEIRIEVAREPKRLRIEISNPSLPARERDGGNRHAQDSIVQRLAYHFGTEARFHRSFQDGVYRCQLLLPLP